MVSAEFDDADLEGVLAQIDVDNEIANPQLNGGEPKAKAKKSRAKDSKPKREAPKMIRAPDGSSFGTCEGCGKRCPAAMLTQYGGYGHECEEVDPTIKLKELAAKEKAKKEAAKDRFEAAKAAAKRELAGREPCKPKSAYQHFCAARRLEIKEEKPDLDPKVLTTLLADDWARVDAERRVRWEAMAAADKELFDERMAACEGNEEGEAEGDDAPKPPPKPKGTKKDAAAAAADGDADGDGGAAEPKPRYKKARTAFFIFCAENRARLLEADPTLKVTEVVKALSAEWKELDADAKAPYVQKYEEEKARLAESPELLPPAKAKGAAGAKRKRAAPQDKGKAGTAEEGADAEAGDAAAEGSEIEEEEAGSGAEDEGDEAMPGGANVKAKGGDDARAESEAAPEPRKAKARKARVVESDDEDA